MNIDELICLKHHFVKYSIFDRQFIFIETLEKCSVLSKVKEGENFSEISGLALYSNDYVC